MADLDKVLIGAHGGSGMLVRVYMSVVETMDPECYAGAVQRQDGHRFAVSMATIKPSVIRSESSTASGCLSVGNYATFAQVFFGVFMSFLKSSINGKHVGAQRVPGTGSWCRRESKDHAIEANSLASHSICDTAFPDPNAPGSDACVLILYDSAATKVQLHDVIDVIGVLEIREAFEVEL